MSICADCFKNGDHQGHDFNMFRSGAGGACDCGDECVMNPKGFCKCHAADHMNAAQQQGPPAELTRCAEFILSNLLYCLLQHFRSLYSSVQASRDSASSRVIMNSILDDVQPCLELLNELCAMGTPMRKILVEYMISEEFYESKIAAETDVGDEQGSVMSYLSLTIILKNHMS